MDCTGLKIVICYVAALQLVGQTNFFLTDQHLAVKSHPAAAYAVVVVGK